MKRKDKRKGKEGKTKGDKKDRKNSVSGRAAYQTMKKKKERKVCEQINT